MFARRSLPCPEILVRNLICVLAVSHDQFRHAPRVQNRVWSQVQMFRNEMCHVSIGVEIGEVTLSCVAYASSALKGFTGDYPKKASASFTASGKDFIICKVACNTVVGVM